jgi:transcriptional regulator with XRE-family HTH domain
VNEFKTSVAKAFGNAVREARAGAKLSQEALALKSSVDRTFVSMVERGVLQPALPTIFALCSALPLTPGALVDRTFVLMPKRRQ